jgi:hypothetical protein
MRVAWYGVLCTYMLFSFKLCPKTSIVLFPLTVKRRSQGSEEMRNYIGPCAASSGSESAFSFETNIFQHRIIIIIMTPNNTDRFGSVSFRGGQEGGHCEKISEQALIRVNSVTDQ